MVINIDSNKIIDTIDFGEAPKALRIPISLVRSFTIKIIILLIPTIPAIKVPKPITSTIIPKLKSFGLQL